MDILESVGLALIATALGGGVYTVAAAILAGRKFGEPATLPLPPFPAVTLLKPLYGAEPGLEDALASFLEQTYGGPLQIVFGLHDSDDPALLVIERLKVRFPDRDIATVIDPTIHGPNRKVSNLINMMSTAKHDVLVLADSDIKVPPNYLSAVTADLGRAGVGVVSCLYSGQGAGDFWPHLAAMGVSYQFLPNAIFGIATGMEHPCFGSTIGLRRETLETIGGFSAFVGYLADDFEIGRAVRAIGNSIAYSRMVLAHRCTESNLSELADHELRWARTIRILNPAGHLGSIVTHPLPLALAGALILGFPPIAWAAIAMVVVARLFLKARIDDITGVQAGSAWLLPVRDLLSFGVFLTSLFGGTVNWRGNRLRVEKDGLISKTRIQ